MRGRRNATSVNVGFNSPRLSDASKVGKLMESFNSKFQAVVNEGKASVTSKETSVKNPADNAEVKFSYPEITVKGYEGALAYFSDPILDKDGKETGEFGYVSADGKTKQTPDELLWELVSKAITNAKKANIRQKTLNDLVPEDVKAIHSAARKMVLAGKFGGNSAEPITSETNVKAFQKAVAILTEAAA